MSLVRLIPAWFHAIADYAVAVTLIFAAIAVGGSGKAIDTGVVVGVVVLAVSMLTRYPLGVVKLLPFDSIRRAITSPLSCSSSHPSPWASTTPMGD